MEEFFITYPGVLLVYFVVFVFLMAAIAGGLAFLGVIFQFIGFLLSLLYYILYGVYKLLEVGIKKIK